MRWAIHHRRANRLRRLRGVRLLFLLATLLGFAQPVAAAPQVLTLDPKTQSYELARHALLLRDTSRALKIEQFDHRATPAGAWFEVDEDAPNYGYTADPFWLDIHLRNATGKEQQWLWEVGYSPLDHVELFIERGPGVWERHQAGDSIAFAQHEVEYRNPVFRIDLPPTDDLRALLRVQSAGTVNIPLTLWSPRGFAAYDHSSQFLFGLLYGVLLVMALYNLTLFAVLRDVTYLYCVLFIVGLGLFEMTENGHAAEYLWPTSPWWTNRSSLVMLGVAQCTGSLFGRAFVKNSANVNKLRLLDLAAGLGLALTLGSLVAPYAWAARASGVAVIYVIVSNVVVLVLVWRGGYSPARYPFVAWSTVLVTGLLNALCSAGVVPRYFFITYGFQLATCAGAVLLSLGLADRIALLRTAMETAELMALTDSLTRLPNRRRLDQVIQGEWQRCVRSRQSLSFIMIDIDYFKLYNDRYGHLAGDACLRKVGEALDKTQRRGADFLARYGGEEFAVVLPDTDLDGAEIVAERLKRAISSLDILHEGSSTQRCVTISLGVATVIPRVESSPSLLIEGADEALYAAKNQGRNRYASQKVA